MDKVDALYDYGVRMITPMHYMVNEIGDIMTAPAKQGKLTEVGRKIVERMMALGIIVDVAHAHYNTLQGIAEIAGANGVPIVDSHTNLTRRNNPYGTTRLRTWEEMEIIAKTNGVVCTWPMSSQPVDSHRTSFLDWAAENLEIAQTIGIDHVGLGTDGGGSLTPLIEGYESILDLPKLADAMDKVGFKPSEISAYMGGNMLRIIKQCLG
jgi:membrane dipeptidase